MQFDRALRTSLAIDGDPVHLVRHSVGAELALRRALSAAVVVALHRRGRVEESAGVDGEHIVEAAAAGVDADRRFAGPST